MLLSCGEKVVCLQLNPRASTRSSKCYINGLKLPKHSIISEDWLEKLFDLSKCRCDIPDCFTTYKGKLFCNCKFDDRVPEKEISFLKDQRLSRKMILTSSKDVMFNKREMQVFVKQSKPSDFIEAKKSK